MKKIRLRELTLREKAIFCTGITGGIIVSPVWWVVNTISLILTLTGRGLTAAGASLSNLKTKQAEEAAEAPVEEGDEVKAAA